MKGLVCLIYISLYIYIYIHNRGGFSFYEGLMLGGAFQCVFIKLGFVLMKGLVYLISISLSIYIYICIYIYNRGEFLSYEGPSGGPNEILGIQVDRRRCNFCVDSLAREWRLVFHRHRRHQTCPARLQQCEVLLQVGPMVRP